MKYESMTVEQFVEATNTVRVGDKVGCSSVRKSDAPAYSAYVKSHKPEIMAYLLGREKAAEERQAKIDAIEGLKEIEAAEEAVLTYREAFAKAMERGDGILPSKPDIDLEALYAKYPRAAAYRTAEANSRAAHDVKATAYTKALERIINGEDYAKALVDADAEWKAHCDAHIWD